MKQVKCISNINQEKYLTIDKIYDVLLVGYRSYRIINDNNCQGDYNDNRFLEEITKMKKVKCIDASHCLRITLGKEYEVLKVTKKIITIINNNGERWAYNKSRFVDVEDMKKIVIYMGGGELFLPKGILFEVKEEGKDYYTLNTEKHPEIFVGYRYPKQYFKETGKYMEKEEILEKTIRVGICVDANYVNAQLTLNKEYNIINESIEYYTVINDRDIEAVYSKKRFKIKDMTEQTNLIPNIVAGNIIELKDGTRGLVIKTPNHKQYVYWATKFIPVDYKEFVVFNKSSNLPKQEDIVKIYAGVTDNEPYAGLTNNIYTMRQTPVWEYKLPRVTLTLEQIAEKFNLKVEQIDIKDYE